MAIFQERTIPAEAQLAGWSALAERFAVPAPVRRPSCVSDQHVSGSQRHEGDWVIFDKRYWQGNSFADQLIFALRHEPIDLLVLKRVFDAVPRQEMEAMVRAAPTGIPVRRAWFLYEALMARTLDVEDAPRAAVIDVLDPKAYAIICWAPGDSAL